MRQPTSFYGDQRFCPRCDRYVLYLLSPSAAFCARCTGRVQLFSLDDMEAFRRGLGEDHGQGFRRERRAPSPAGRNL